MFKNKENFYWYTCCFIISLQTKSLQTNYRETEMVKCLCVKLICPFPLRFLYLVHLKQTMYIHVILVLKMGHSVIPIFKMDSFCLLFSYYTSTVLTSTCTLWAWYLYFHIFKTGLVSWCQAWTCLIKSKHAISIMTN